MIDMCPTNMKLRILTVFFVCAIANVGFTSEEVVDSNAVPEWITIKNLMFGDRSITSGNRSKITLSINKNIDDASTVPLVISGGINQKSDERFEKIYIIVDQNPIPTAAVFELSPSQGPLYLETRLRIEKFSFIRALGETADGNLHMATHWVEVQGGCSAPAGKNAGIDPHLGKMKFNLKKYRNMFKSVEGDRVFRVNLDEPNLVKVQVRHPNESALASDLDNPAEANYIRNIVVDYGGEMVLSAQVNFSISDNPAFRFSLAPKSEGELSFTVTDTHENQFTQKVNILGPSR